MQQVIHHVPPRATARIVAAVGGALALAGMLLAGLLSIWLPGVATFHNMPMALALFLVPIGWWLSLYLSTWIVCGMYNLCAPHFGGITLVLDDATAVQRPR
ncbi:hypothetical protein [Kinneretia aquatilis]|uniref:hypothetical protein n=1 Tax=Kinneretia aquatilis TaxID=2070761 RepID=UPI001495371A|nr:hypothetical protein [Paucibacter aquatile]WIV97973.1 hypothetical protein K9V56_000265 [Paucibacter aquatile]